MSDLLNHLIFSALAYLAGSISTAIITCRLMGLKDPRTTGSHNPGATNVLRHGGKKAAIITLIGDMLKGLIPVMIAVQLQMSMSIVAFTALFAFLGHVFPVYYGFRGGKGVATYYGAILAINWQTGVIALVIWLTVAALLKISSLSALVSIFSTPFILWYFSQSIELTAAAAVMSLIVFWRHRTNIQALLAGSEEKIGTDSK
jgi:glycerol-3-phosphate acyltransferase PlsY